MITPVNVLANELADMVLYETQAYLNAGKDQPFEPATFRQNVRAAIRLFFSEYGLLAVKTDSFKDLEGRVRPSIEQKLRSEISVV